MWKIILTISTFIGLLGVACEKTVSIQKENTSSKVIESPSIVSKQENLNTDSLESQAKNHLNQGLKYKAAGEYERAIEEFKKSIEAGNDDKEMYRRIAELYLALKKYEDAETCLQRILDKDSKDAMAHWALAKILVENLGKFDEGLKEAILAKELYGEDGSSYVHDRVIGKAYEGLGSKENAIKHYKLFLKGSSFIPDSTDHKEIKKRVLELERK